MTVSRTAIVALGVCALVLFPGWPPRLRMRMAIALAVGLVGMRLAIPGLLGTLKSFLLNPAQDPSLASRRISADYVYTFINQRPWLGRGFQTFLPTRYEFLDNQMLLSLVETGALGLAALLSVLAVAGMMTRVVRAVSTQFADRDLAQALLACLLVGYATWFTYDALGFPTGRTLLFLAAGCAGALWRIVWSEAYPPAAADDPPAADDPRAAESEPDSGRSLTRRAGLPA
jgi:polysaccharide biosynthesis protein PslJ